MLTTKEQAQSLLNSISVGQDELSIINQLMTVSSDVIKEMVAIIKESNICQCERDKITLEFYDKSCDKILEIIGNPDLSETKTKDLINLFRELEQLRQKEKDKQDKNTREGKNSTYLFLTGSLLGVIALVLLCGKQQQ